MVIEFYKLKEPLPSNLYIVQKELNSGKVSGLPRVKQEGRTASQAVILRLFNL